MDRSSLLSSMSKDLCNDIIVEILSWLPVDSILRFKSVCKSWLNLIITPRFAKLHIHHHHHHHHHHHSLATITPGATQILKPSIMFISDKNYHMKSMDEVLVAASSSSYISSIIEKQEMVNSFDFPQHFVKIVGSCNGLICLCAYDDCENNILYLWNPTIKEFQSLPSHEDDDDSDNTNAAFQYRKIWWYGIGYDRVIDDFKVIASAQLWDGLWGWGGSCLWESEVKIFTLGKNSWRRIQVKPPYEFESESFISSRSLRTWTYVNGAFHRLARLSPSEHKILSFDIVDQVYREVPNPECFDTRYVWELAVLRGCLCLSGAQIFTGHDRCMESWMMMDYSVKESWTKLFRITNVVRNRNHRMKPEWFCKKGELLIEAGVSNQLVIYDMKHADEVKWPKTVLFDSRFETTIYTGSLVSLKSQG